jgi:hypothetical protein
MADRPFSCGSLQPVNRLRACARLGRGLIPALYSLTIGSRTFDDLRSHVSAGYPAEAAGLLVGPGSGLIATATFPLQSESMVPRRRVVVSRRQLSDALDVIRAGGLYYVDIVAASRPGVEVIATVTPYGVGVVRAWLVGPGVDPRPLEVRVTS